MERKSSSKRGGDGGGSTGGKRWRWSGVMRRGIIEGRGVIIKEGQKEEDEVMDEEEGRRQGGLGAGCREIEEVVSQKR